MEAQKRVSTSRESSSQRIWMDFQDLLSFAFGVWTFCVSSIVLRGTDRNSAIVIRHMASSSRNMHIFQTIWHMDPLQTNCDACQGSHDMARTCGHGGLGHGMSRNILTRKILTQLDMEHSEHDTKPGTKRWMTDFHYVCVCCSWVLFGFPEFQTSRRRWRRTKSVRS